jgi:hypothetical protein
MSSAENEDADLMITTELIGKFANTIIDIIRHDKYTDTYHMVPGMNLSEMVKNDVECWRHLFQKKNTVKTTTGTIVFSGMMEN